MMSRDIKMAIAFTEELAEWGIIPEKYSGRPMHTASMLLDYVYSFEFRPTRYDGVDDSVGIEQQRKYYSEDTLGNYHPRNNTIRRIINEYDGLTPSDYEDFD